MAERIDMLPVIGAAVRVMRAANLHGYADDLNEAGYVAAELIEFLRDADCNCRPATEQYAAHTCRRCDLLARIGSAS